MRLSELLGSEVLDEQGRSAGRVRDVRLERDGPPAGGAGARFRLAGLIVGRHAVGVRLGYVRGEVQGPWLVKALTESLHRGGRYVDWGRVRSVQPHRILISGSVGDLPSVNPG
jgi:hypothetical protein